MRFEKGTHTNRLLVAVAAVAMLACVLFAFSPVDDNQSDAAITGENINGEVGVEFEKIVRYIPGVNNPNSASFFSIGETNIPDDLGITVSTNYDGGVGTAYRMQIIVSGTPQYHVGDVDNAKWDGAYEIQVLRNGEEYQTFTGQMVFRGVTSISLNGQNGIDINSDDKTAAITATIDPVDVQEKEIVWTIYDGDDKAEIKSYSGSETGSVCIIEAKATGSVIVRATMAIDIDVFAEWRVLIKDDLLIVEPIEDEIAINSEYTRTPQVTLAGEKVDADIAIVEVTLNGNVMQSSTYSDFIYVEDRTIHATLPEEGVWRITYEASYSTANPVQGQIVLEATDKQEEANPVVTGINAYPDYAYDKMWNFVAVDADNYIGIEWDFGDGSKPETGSSRVVHTYGSEGYYTVTVTLTNSLGVTAKASTDIVVFGQDPGTDAWMNIQYTWVYRVVDDMQQYVFDTDAQWLDDEMKVIGDETYIIISGTPTVNNAQSRTTYNASLSINDTILSWQITVSPQETEAPVCSFNIDANSENSMIVELNFTGSNASNILIDWGDGNGSRVYKNFNDVITFTYPAADTYTIKVIARNNVGESDPVTKTFTARYDESQTTSPTLNPIEDVSVFKGESFSFTVTFTPAEAKIGVQGPSWVHVDGNRIYGTPTATGDYQITVMASYGSLSAKQTFNIHVTESGGSGGDGDDDTPGGGDGGDGGDKDGNGDGETDWTMFALCAIIMILVAAALWYYQYPILIVVPIIGIIVAAWYTGVF